MCGIAGFMGSYAPSVAEQMQRRIAHRGPDAHGLFSDPASGIALAHQRLSIIDLSQAGAQPMTDRSGRFVMSYNGEVYNFRDLRRDLERSGSHFRGHSDTEIALEIFARHGAEGLAQLNGIFALAIWDKQERTLTLARDGLGVKPLYWTHTRSGFAFASELKALLALPDLDKSLDHGAVAAYLTYLWSPGEMTMFKSVKKLKPGHWLTIGQDLQPREGCFYRLPQLIPNEAMTAQEAIDGTALQLGNAIERQMISDVEVGGFLSGGLDSSAIVALARHQNPDAKPMRCFTIDFQASGTKSAEMVEDLPYAEAVAAHLGVELDRVPVDSSIATGFENLVYQLDEPQADFAALNSLLIATLARQSGIKVLLSGTGGDDFLTGYRRHTAASYDGIWDWMPVSLRRVAAKGAVAFIPPDGRLRRVRKLLENCDLSADGRAAGYFEWAPRSLVSDLFSPELRQAAASGWQPLLQTLESTDAKDQLSRVLWLDQHHFLTDHNLNYTDKSGMATGVEVRVPFLDLDFVKWAASMPNRYKIRNGMTKWAFRKAMEPYLPKQVIYRPKSGFGVPLRAWLKHELRPMADDLLSAATVKNRGLFDIAAVSALRQDTDSGRRDGSYTLLALMAIELWCRRFVDTTEQVLMV
jgi:asparagine synthase (glutamine-hydrolysing)